MNHRDGKRTLVCFACCLLGCAAAPGGPAPSDLSDANGPVYLWQRSLHGDPAAAGTIVAVDGNDQGWYYTGVANQGVTLHPWRTLSAAEIASIEAAFSELPPTPISCSEGIEDDEGFVESFARRTQTSDTEWNGCTTTDNGNLVLAEPYSDVTGALNALTFGQLF
jgi:hypothetical protein